MPIHLTQSEHVQFFCFFGRRLVQNDHRPFFINQFFYTHKLINIERFIHLTDKVSTARRTLLYDQRKSKDRNDC